jgi:hypothetical protein
MEISHDKNQCEHCGAVADGRVFCGGVAKCGGRTGFTARSGCGAADATFGAACA